MLMWTPGSVFYLNGTGTYVEGRAVECGFGSAWLTIHFRSWIRFRIQYADTDPEGKIFQIKSETMQRNSKLLQVYSTF